MAAEATEIPYVSQSPSLHDDTVSSSPTTAIDPTAEIVSDANNHPVVEQIRTPVSEVSNSAKSIDSNGKEIHYFSLSPSLHDDTVPSSLTTAVDPTAEVDSDANNQPVIEQIRNPESEVADVAKSIDPNDKESVTDPAKHPRANEEEEVDPREVKRRKKNSPAPLEKVTGEPPGLNDAAAKEFSFSFDAAGFSSLGTTPKFGSFNAATVTESAEKIDLAEEELVDGIGIPASCFTEEEKGYGPVEG